MNRVNAMRKINSLALLLLGGCATAAGPQPVVVPAAPVAVNIRPVDADPVVPQGKVIEIRTGACETNDRMAVGTARAAPQGHPAPMPGMRMHAPVAPMPNACPVTVPSTGQMFYHAVPTGAVKIRVQKRAPQAQP